MDYFIDMRDEIKMDLRSEEYSSLRAELLEEQSAQANLLLAMYTIFIALITFAIDKQNHYLLIFSIYVNLLFKLQILWKHTGRMRIVAYLIVNYEKKSKDVQWELDLDRIERYHNKFLKMWLKIVSFSSSKVVTLMSVISCLLVFVFPFQTQQKSFLYIVVLMLSVMGVLMHIFLDYMQSRKDLKIFFMEEFEKANKDKIK